MGNKGQELCWLLVNCELENSDLVRRDSPEALMGKTTSLEH